LDEITELSKRDALSSVENVVLAHTSRFIAQYIARAAKGLATNEPEIVTLAYTGLKGVMCVWWDKPLDA
jgi:hypothetical protein